MGTLNVKPRSQEVLITKSVSQFFNTSARNCEMAALHAKNNKIWSVNNEEKFWNLSAETNGKLRLQPVLKQQKSQVTSHKKGEPQDPYSVKQKIKIMGQGKRTKVENRQELTSVLGSPRHWRRNRTIDFRQLKIMVRFEILKPSNKVTKHRHQIILTTFKNRHQN